MSSLASKTSFFQVVDASLGRFACWCCELLRFFGFGSGAEAGRRGLLFIKLAEQGSTVLAAGAIAAAVRRHGRENVYFLVFDENRFILDMLRLIPEENVLVVDTGSFTRIVQTGLLQLGRIRRQRLLECVDLEFFARLTAVFAFLTGIPKRVGFHSYFGEGPWRGNLFTHRPRYNPHLHTSVTFRSLVAALDVSPQSFPRFDWAPEVEPVELPRFQPTARETEAMRTLIAAHGQPSSLILLNANASDLIPVRRWADENYVALARRLLAADNGTFVAFTGSPSEAPKTEEIVRAIGSPRAFCAAGKTTLRELLALYQLADVLVTNDSGPAHFAALTRIHTVVLFGPETPLLFGSLSPRSQPLTSGIACSPCVSAFNNRQTACRNNVCMQKISVERVFEAVHAALAERAGDKAATSTW